jgi:hypothetical protein
MNDMRILNLGLDWGGGMKHLGMLGLLLIQGLLLLLEHLTLVRVKLLLLRFLLREWLLLHVLHVNILRMLL